MANRLIKETQTKYTPGVAGVPATPARCYYVTETQYDITGALELYNKIYQQIVVGGSASNIQNQLNSLDGLFFFGTYPSKEVEVYKCDPAIPGTSGTPPKISYDPQIGWNAGGSSIDTIPANSQGYAEFEVGPTTIGAFVGFSNYDEGVSPGDQTHSFYIHRGVVDIYERGVFKFTTSIDITARPRLRLTRGLDGSVIYMANGVPVYSSTLKNTGVLRLDASLYTSNDYVDNPELGVSRSASGSIPYAYRSTIDSRPRGKTLMGLTNTGNPIVDGVRYARGVGLFDFAGSAAPHVEQFGVGTTLMGLTNTATRGDTGVDGIAPQFGLFASDRPLCQMVGHYGGYQLEATMSDFTLTTSGMYGVVPQVISSALLITGEVMTMTDAPVPSFDLFAADRPMAQMVGVWGGITVGTSYAPPYGPGSVNLIEGMILSDSWKADKTFSGTFASVLSIATEFEGAVLLDADFQSGLLILTSMQSSVDLEGMFTSELILSTQSNTNRQRGLQYSVNAVTNAISCYNDFDFVKFITTPTGVYGVKEDGVYLITEGVGNDGMSMEAILDMGEQNLGTSHPKYIAQAFAGIYTDGRVFLKLTDDDGCEFIYEVVGDDPVRWATIARGVKSKDWRIQLQVIDATTVELDNIEFDIGISSRRTRR